MKHVVVALSTCLALSLAPRLALACAAGPVSSSGSVGSDAQRIFVAAGPTKTEVVLQVTVPATSEAYGLLIPLPVQPTLDATPVAVSELDQLDRATQPAIVDDTPSGGGGVGCGSATDAAVGGTRNGVEVVQTVALGPLVAVVLTADTSDALTTWLHDNGFVLPGSASVLIARYVKPGAYFIAAKRADAVPAGAPSSLGVHFTLPGEQLTIPLPVASIGGGTEIAFEIFAATASPVGPLTPYAPLGLADLDKSTVRTGTYRAGLARAVAAKSGRAFVSEGVYPMSSGALTGRLATFVEGTWSITRLTTVTSPAALTEDLVLSAVQAPSTETLLDVTEPSDGCTSTSGAASPLVWGALLFAFVRRARRA